MLSYRSMLLVLVGVVSLGIPLTVLSATAKTDLRIVVDVSGSMKKTDPDNLRRPALRLLAGLLPDGSRAGLWSFGQYVNMTVKPASVDTGWREAVYRESEKIRSLGLFTNIEEALRQASYDWQAPDPAYQRHLLLLTDGMVDVSEDASLDQASRQRILNEVLPRLEKAGVRIHSVALSDAVDETLLSTLSNYTNGLFKKIKDAKELKPIFLQILQQSAHLDTLPLQNNRFNVDSQVKDMTLLVFNQAQTTTLSMPDGSQLSAASPQQASWHSDKGFDLITVKQPQAGQWTINAPLDDNNRVVVVTNLKLQVDELPSNFLVGDGLFVNARLQENEKSLDNQALVQQFKFSMLLQEKNAASNEYKMSPVTGSQHQEYQYQLPKLLKAGDYEVVVQAISPTISREVRQQFKVYAEPAELSIVHQQQQVIVEVTPAINLLRAGSVQLGIQLHDATHKPLLQQADKWRVVLPEKYFDTMATIEMQAQRADGQPLLISFDRVLTSSNTGALDLAELHPAAANPEITKQPASHPPVTAEAPQPEYDWGYIMVIILVVNILIIIALVTGFIYFRKCRVNMLEKLQAEIK